MFPNSSATSKVEASMYLSNKSGDISNKVTFYFCPDVEDKPPELEATRQVVTTKRSSAALKATAQETGQDQDQVVEEKSAGSIAVPPQRVRQSEESNNPPEFSFADFILQLDPIEALATASSVPNSTGTRDFLVSEAEQAVGIAQFLNDLDQGI